MACIMESGGLRRLEISGKAYFLTFIVHECIMQSEMRSQKSIMKTMTLRNIPDPVYEALAENARAEHRSLQEQVRYILTNDVALRSRSVCEKAAEYRVKLAGRVSEKSVVEELHEDRDR